MLQKSQRLFWLAIAVGLADAVLRGTPTSWLALDDQPLCTLPATGNFSGMVQVFVHHDNSRHLEFGDAWSGTQTTVSCRGDLPSSCLANFQESGPASDCAAVNCPCDRDASNVDTEYLAKMVNTVVPLCKAASSAPQFNILNIGLGGGDIPAYILSHCPENTHVQSIEYDPRVVSVAEKFFGTNDGKGRHTVITGDGGAEAAALLGEGKQYDAILVDVFDDAGDVPKSCVNNAFLKTVHGLLRPSGKFVQQVWDRQHAELISGLRHQFEQEPGGQVEDGDGRHGQWVLVATRSAS
jgi:SAM-dependent methyltransferase